MADNSNSFSERHLTVKRSGLPGAGKGLFTTQDISRGTRIIEYKGRITKWNAVKDQDGYNGYLMFMGPNHVINALPTLWAKARYANDARGLSRKPGLRNNAAYVADGKRCFIEASRKIKAGEEILVFYGTSYWRLVRKLKRLTKVIPKG